MKPLTIGALARRAGVGVETVRFYERRGLIARPPRPRSGFRVYPGEAADRIRFIRHAQALGFTLTEAGELLALRVAPGADCAAVRSRAVTKLTGVERRIDELRRVRDALKRLIAACPNRGAIANCSILDALSTATPPSPAHEKPPRTRGMKSLDLTIQGMHCDGCAATLEVILGREPGVKAARVSFPAGKGRILYDPGSTTPAKLAATVRQAGYHVATDPSSATE